jgi:hypothetical protein
MVFDKLAPFKQAYHRLTRQSDPAGSDYVAGLAVFRPVRLCEPDTGSRRLTTKSLCRR